MNADEMIAHAEAMSLNYNENGWYQGDSGLNGCSRSVELRGGFAFKAVFSARNRDNVAEWDFYTMTTDEVRQYLAKPVYISRNGRVIVMEELTVDIAYSHIAKALVKATKKAHNFALYDLHSGNFGQRADGTVVCLDYGNVTFNVMGGAPDPKSDYSTEEMAMRLLSI